jgi:hypothetical protein
MILTIVLSSSLCSLITGFLFRGSSHLEPVVNPTTQASTLRCSTSLMMCDVPSMAVFVENVLNDVLVLILDIF